MYRLLLIWCIWTPCCNMTDERGVGSGRKKELCGFKGEFLKKNGLNGYRKKTFQEDDLTRD